MTDQLLRTSLLDLMHLLGDYSSSVLLGGGYGLYLKQLHLAHAGQRTLVPAELWPPPRATEDLDLVLSAEIVADADAMAAVRLAMDQLGYVVVEGSEYLQFARVVAGGQIVKIDLLTAQLDVLLGYPSITADDRRARPAAGNRPQLHAHPTDGALALRESPLTIDVEGVLSDGAALTARVSIPHPFSYLLMKLTAYRDRRDNEAKEYGQHHALDVFRIIAMLTEESRDQVKSRIARLSGNTQVKSCRTVVASDFSRPASRGLLAMRGHQLWQNDADIEVFIETLTDLFA